jgi:integrase
MGRVYLRGDIWWIQYSRKGKKKRESSGSSKRPVAVKLLQKRQQEAGKGRPHDEAVKVTLSELKARIEADYELQERRSGKRLGQLWAHLAAYFGKDEPAVKIDTARVEDYVTARLAEGAARGTIKNELNALRRAFRLALEKKVLLADEVPVFPTIKTSEARKGFFEREEHNRVRAALPGDAADLAEFLFWTGWRTSEAKGLRWPNVDAAAGIIRIDTTKSGEPRTLPYSVLPALADLIAHRRDVTDQVQRRRGIVVPWVFHRNGERIRYFRRAWTSACIAAGLGQEIREPQTGRLLRKVALRLPHDYRRSAARNLSRAGVPEGVIMKLCGWKTRSVFDRYRIVAERDLAEGLAKLAAKAPASRTAKVARMTRSKV